MVDHVALIEKLGRALNENSPALLADVYTDDVLEEYPQSGELIRGRANILAIVENYPGRTPEMPLGHADTINVRGFDAFKIVAPTFVVVKVEGGGENGVSTVRATYPDGSTWWIVSIYTLRGGRIAYARTFFAPDFPAPEWRAQWVEKMPVR